MYPNRPTLNRDTDRIRRQLGAAFTTAKEAKAMATGAMAKAAAPPTFHIATCRLTALLVLGGSVDRTLTWSGGGFASTDYDVEFGRLDMAGMATLTEVGRTQTAITVRVAATLALAAGATFIVVGKAKAS